MKNKGSFGTFCIYAVSLAIILIIVLLVISLEEGVKFSPDEETETHLECINNECVPVEGIGLGLCSAEGAFCGCLDTDIDEIYTMGINFFKQGIVRNLTESLSDRCNSEGKLIEYGCREDNELIRFEISCESLGNYTCISGECYPDTLEFRDCSDSDGGSRPFVYGKANNGKIRIDDYCLSEEELIETYCQEGSPEILIERIVCSNLGSYVCESGECVSTI